MVNDITIATGILIIMISMTMVLPQVYEAFDDLSVDIDEGSTSDIDYSNYVGNVTSELDDANDLNAWQGWKAIRNVFIWSFGNLPWWIEGILLVMRITILAILIRNLWPGGGA